MLTPKILTIFYMKRWPTHTISTLWLLIATSGMMATTVAAADNASLTSSQGVNIDTVLLAQSETILELGSTGAAVKDVQAMLALMGYYSGVVDGNYEQMTAAAVRQFQADAGLTIDGVVGPLTWQRLLPTTASLTTPQALEPPGDGLESTPSEADVNPSAEPPSDNAGSRTAGNLPILQLDDSGEEVSRLQRRLMELNLYQGPIDGIFGSQTQQAVEQLQRQASLEVDGIVGPATWLELLE